MKRLHPVFHVSLLEPYIENELEDRYEPAPHPVEIVDDNQYEVEQVLDVRLKDNKVQYLLHWKGFGIADRSWEDFDNINCRRLISEFYNNNMINIGHDDFKSRYPDNHCLTELDPKGGGTVKISPWTFTETSSNGTAGRSKAQ